MHSSSKESERQILVTSSCISLILYNTFGIQPPKMDFDNFSKRCINYNNNLVKILSCFACYHGIEFRLITETVGPQQNV